MELTGACSNCDQQRFVSTSKAAFSGSSSCPASPVLTQLFPLVHQAYSESMPQNFALSPAGVVSLLGEGNKLLPAWRTVCVSKEKEETDMCN